MLITSAVIREDWFQTCVMLARGEMVVYKGEGIITVNHSSCNYTKFSTHIVRYFYWSIVCRPSCYTTTHRWNVWTNKLQQLHRFHNPAETVLRRHAIDRTINIRERYLDICDWQRFPQGSCNVVVAAMTTRDSPLKIYSLVKSQYWFWHRTSYVRSVYAMLFPVSW